MKLNELTEQYEYLKHEGEWLNSQIIFSDSIGLTALTDELEDRLDKVESLMYVVNTQIKKLEALQWK